MCDRVRKNIFSLVSVLILVGVSLSFNLPLSEAAPVRILFIHQSCGKGLINACASWQFNDITPGDASWPQTTRGIIEAYNTANGTSYEFWDHGYDNSGDTSSNLNGIRDNVNTLIYSNIFGDYSYVPITEDYYDFNRSDTYNNFLTMFQEPIDLDNPNQILLHR